MHFLVHLSGFSESRFDLLLQKIVYGQHVFFFHARQYMGVPVEGDADRRMVRGFRNNFLWIFLQRESGESMSLSEGRQVGQICPIIY